jgi:hypothetical protein
VLSTSFHRWSLLAAGGEWRANGGSQYLRSLRRPANANTEEEIGQQSSDM